MKYTDMKLQTLEDEGIFLSLENIIRGGISLVMGKKYVKSDKREEILYIDA